MAKNKLWLIVAAVLTALLLTNNSHAESKLDFPGPAPGNAQGIVLNEELILSNKLIRCIWSMPEGGGLKPQYIRNKLTKKTIQMLDTQCFLFVLEGGLLSERMNRNVIAP